MTNKNKLVITTKIKRGPNKKGEDRIKWGDARRLAAVVGAAAAFAHNKIYKKPKTKYKI